DISDELEDYANQLNNLAAAVCDCPQDVGHTSIGECLDDRSVDPDERECQADVTTGYEEETKAYLDCIIPKLDPYIQCLEMNPGCVDGWWSDCTDAYIDDTSSCPKFPDEIAVDFVECTTPLSQP
ncbi:MAG: hypothetical protein KC431_07540, partial [Myxococcales bacterium]|nr:hypothetical protein [Myxococcales bacterium]